MTSTDSTTQTSTAPESAPASAPESAPASATTAQTNAQRIATVVRGSGAGKSVTGDNRTARKTTSKRTSSTKKTVATRTPAKQVKTVKKSAPKGPSRTALNRALGTALIKSAADFASRPSTLTKEMRAAGVTQEQVLDQVTQWVAYIPGDVDPRLVKYLRGSYGGRRNVA